MTLDASELTDIRAIIEADLLPDTCNLLTVTRTSDSQGGYTDAWGTATASVKCRLDQKRAIEAVTGGALNPYTTWILTLPYDTTITEQYRVEVGSSTFNVVSVDDAKSWKASVRCRLEKV